MRGISAVAATLDALVFYWLLLLLIMMRVSAVVTFDKLLVFALRHSRCARRWMRIPSIGLVVISTCLELGCQGRTMLLLVLVLAHCYVIRVSVDFRKCVVATRRCCTSKMVLLLLMLR